MLGLDEGVGQGSCRHCRHRPVRLLGMESEVLLSTRVSKSLHAKILEHQKKIKAKTGIALSVSAVLREMIRRASELEDVLAANSDGWSTKKRA